MKLTWMAAVAFCAMTSVTEAALIGTDLLYEGVFQSTSASQAIRLTSLTTVTVKEPGVEIPSLKALQVSNSLGLSLLDVSINVGDRFIEIDFDNTAPFNQFATGFRNSSVFTFDSVVRPSISSALIDRSVTTLGLSDSDVTFTGNTLEVNFEGLPFNTSTFVRINLELTPVPIPPAMWLFGTGLAALAALRKRKG